MKGGFDSDFFQYKNRYSPAQSRTGVGGFRHVFLINLELVPEPSMMDRYTTGLVLASRAGEC